MADFYKLRVNDIVRETPSSVSLSFDVPSDIKNEFLFTQGQYITLKLSVNDEELRRCYSICTSPNDGELRVAVKKVEDGKRNTFDFFKNIRTNFINFFWFKPAPGRHHYFNFILTSNTLANTATNTKTIIYNVT